MRIPAITLALTALCYAEPASNNKASPYGETAPPSNVASAQGAPDGAFYPQGAANSVQAGNQGLGYAVQDSKLDTYAAQPDWGSRALDAAGPPSPAGLRTNAGQFVAMPGIALPKVQSQEQFRPKQERQPPALKNPVQASSEGLIPGDVFGLITLSDNHDVNGETVVIYQDGTLGINEPNSPGYLFEATLMPEYDLLIVPEPLQTVKLNDKGVLFVNDSLYNPAPIFSSSQWSLRMDDGHGVICPSWNSVLVYVNKDDAPPCSDAVDVNLHIVPITV